MEVEVGCDWICKFMVQKPEQSEQIGICDDKHWQYDYTSHRFDKQLSCQSLDVDSRDEGLSVG